MGTRLEGAPQVLDSTRGRDEWWVDGGVREAVRMLCGMLCALDGNPFPLEGAAHHATHQGSGVSQTWLGREMGGTMSSEDWDL